MNAVFDEIQSLGVVPVAVIDDIEAALPLGDALLRGGLSCVEVTFRTSVAPATIEVLVTAYPDLLVGAGTVNTLTDARNARDAGARFVMSPGFDEEVVDWCMTHGLPVAPGVMTPTEVNRARRRDLRVVKFFPAELAGGVETIGALGGVYPDVRFIPTGGIDETNLAQYLADRHVIACGGSWLVPRGMVRAREFDDIEGLVAGAVAIVRKARSDVS